MKNWYKYEAYLDIGYYNAERTEEIDLRDYEMTENIWHSMSDKEKDSWIENNLNEIAEDLMNNFVEYGIRKQSH